MNTRETLQRLTEICDQMTPTVYELHDLGEHNLAVRLQGLNEDLRMKINKMRVDAYGE